MGPLQKKKRPPEGNRSRRETDDHLFLTTWPDGFPSLYHQYPIIKPPRYHVRLSLRRAHTIELGVESGRRGTRTLDLLDVNQAL